MSAIVDFRAMTSTTDFRDADLLELIERCTDVMQQQRRLMDRANRYKEDGRIYRRMWKELLAFNPERERLEKLVSTTNARTSLGAIAKGQLWLEQHADNSGTMMDLPRSAMADLMVLLGETGA